MGLSVFIDGEYLDEKDAKISVFDHGLLYGDGIFEGIRVYGKRVFMLEKHLDRLYNGAKVLRLDIPGSREELKENILETVRINDIEDGYIRLIVTRGVGDLGLSPTKCGRSSIIIIAATIKIYPDEVYEKGLKVVTVSTRRNLPHSLDPQIKSLNYLNHIMAHWEAHHYGADEGLVLNNLGFVAECIVDNIFIVENGRLLTPPTAMGALKGITRDVVIDIAEREGMEVSEKILTLVDCYIADECFLTGTAAEVAPITHIDERPVGDGSPGPVTKKLMQVFKELTKTTGVPV